MTYPNSTWIYPGLAQGLRRHLFDSSINDMAALSALLGFQDAYTRGHARRVAAYSRRIARRIGLSAETAETIRIGGLLHDIGKIAFSAELLNNTHEQLSEAMRAEIQRHPEIGGHFLKAINVSQPVIDCVRYHHERLDGSGYPFGLTAEDIPLTVRIVSVADCFDALTTDRSYQKKRITLEALAILESLGDETLPRELVTELIADVRANGLQDDPHLDSE
jgi:putative nucleotidyltransferase with HDIG domain